MKLTYLHPSFLDIELDVQQILLTGSATPLLGGDYEPGDDVLAPLKEDTEPIMLDATSICFEE